MKVLLVGEYSGVHNNLKRGLEKLGAKVILINGGDGWKHFGADIKLFELTDERYKKMYNHCIMELNKMRLRDIDVVQFINPSYFYYIEEYFADLALELMDRAKVSVSLLAGCDANMAMYYDMVAPNICPICLKDCKRHGGRCIFHMDRHYKEYERKFYDKIDAIVPGEWLYYKIYHDFVQTYNHKLEEMILYPVDCEKIKPEYSNHSRLIVYHPLNKANKGTVLIKKAFRNLKKKYSKEVSFEVCGHMPFKQYLKYLDGIDIMVDGMKGYGDGFGMSSLIAMSKGKVVAGPRVKEEIPGMDNGWLFDNPQIDVGEGWKGVADAVEYIINHREKLEIIKKESRKYVETYYDSIKIAKKYLALYKRLLKAD